MKVRFIRPVDGFTMDRPYIVPDSHGRHYIAGKMAVSAEDSGDHEDVPAVINRPPSVVADPVAPIIRRTDKASPENAKTEEDVADSDDNSEVQGKAGLPTDVTERQPEHVEIVEGKDGLKSPKRPSNPKAESTKTSQATAKTTSKSKATVAKGKKP